MAGFDVHHRVKTAGPAATIAETALEVVGDVGWGGPVGIFQVTSPGITPERIRDEVDGFLQDPTLRTAASVTAVHDVCYTPDGQVLGAAVNRQYSDPIVWRTTGGIRLIRDPALLPETVDMDGHHLIELSGPEAVDIDDHAQLAGARQALHATRVLFVAGVGHDVGSGHLHRCLTLADELAHHDVAFQLLYADGDPAARWVDLIEATGHRIAVDYEPPTGSVVVLDVLRADPEYVWMLRKRGVHVVSLEDDGPAAPLASLVVNELLHGGEHTGPDFAVLRPEFLTGGRHEPTWREAQIGGNPNDRVLLYFGGTDPAGLAPRVSHLARSLAFDVSDHTGADGTEDVTLAEAMATHDLLVTAAGRAIYAAAAVGIPTIAIPTSSREADHMQLDSALYLPRHEMVSDAEIAATVLSLTGHPGLRREMSARGRLLVDGRGTQRVAALIDNLIQGI
jgi:spore coat polysaccharide biosynthesis predicted glycosyltransferase SpsG